MLAERAQTSASSRHSSEQSTHSSPVVDARREYCSTAGRRHRDGFIDLPCLAADAKALLMRSESACKAACDSHPPPTPRPTARYRRASPHSCPCTSTRGSAKPEVADGTEYLRIAAHTDTEGGFTRSSDYRGCAADTQRSRIGQPASGGMRLDQTKEDDLWRGEDPRRFSS
jgi:hypothetical protein